MQRAFLGIIVDTLRIMSPITEMMYIFPMSLPCSSINVECASVSVFVFI